MTDIMNEVLLNTEMFGAGVACAADPRSIDIHQHLGTPAGDVIQQWECGEFFGACQLWGRSVYNSSTYAAVLFNAVCRPPPHTTHHTHARRAR